MILERRKANKMSQNMSPDFLSGGIFQSTGLKKAKQSTVLSLTEESEI